MSAYNEQRKDSLPSSFYGLLAARQHRLNQVVGIRRITTQVGLLLELYQEAKEREAQQQNERLGELTKKAFYLGVIRGARKRIKEIKQQVTLDTPLDEAQRLYQEVMLLQDKIAEAMKAMGE